jgi:hypothetical protein
LQDLVNFCPNAAWRFNPLDDEMYRVGADAG